MTQPTPPKIDLSDLPPEMVRPLSVAAGIVGGIIGFFIGGFQGLAHHLGGAIDIVLAVVGAVVGFLAVPYALKLLLARITAEKAWCDKHGWTWVGGSAPWNHVPGDVETSVGKSRIFSHEAGWADVMVRETGGVPAIFCRRDSQYRDSDGVEHDGDSHTFIIVRYQGDCPDTTIESRAFAWLPKIGGRQDVEFESADFNKKWNVQSEDAKAAYDRIDQSTIEFLLNEKLQPTIELIDGVLLVKFDSREDSEEEREASLRWVEGFSRAVPDDLMQKMSLF